MSRSSRRRARARAGTPPDVVRHQPVPFDDATDSPDLQEGVSTPRQGVVLWPDSRLAPLSPRPLPVLPLRSVGRAGVRGSMPRAKPVVRRALPVDARVLVQRGKAFPHKGKVSVSQEEASRERRRRLFNVLAVPFSRRARFCLRRKARREVLFALRTRNLINKRSPGGAGGYKRKESSQWRC